MIKDKSIFIKNIYYMLSYAFISLKQDAYKNIDKESFDNIHNLFASILAKGIGLQLKHGLYKEYVSKMENLSVMRGKLEINGTIKNKINSKQLLTCEYDELSENNLFNQILKSTSLLLIKNSSVQSKYKNELKLVLLYFNDIDLVDLKSVRWSQIRIHRNNQNYKLLLGICQLICDKMIITTDEGNYKLATFIDEQNMCRLYEKFILEYYAKEFKKYGIKSNASQIDWILDDGNDTMLPIMQSDIMLSRGNDILIIDAKYYSHATQVQFDKHTIHSPNIYQIYTYVKNKESSLKNVPHHVSGMLLYAKTDEEVLPNNNYLMDGNLIMVRTLDLNLEFDLIAKQLNKIAIDYFDIK